MDRVADLMDQAVRSVSKASGPRNIAGGVGSGRGWVVAVFGAGDQDALDGAVVRIPDGSALAQAASRRVIAVGLAEPDDPLDGPQAVNRVHL